MTNSQQKTELPKKPFQFFWLTMQPHRKWFFSTVFFVVLASAGSQSMSYFFKLIVDAVEAGQNQSVLFYALMYPVALFVVQLLYRSSGYCGMKTVTDIMKTASDRISEHTLRHSHGYYADRFAGSILTKYGNIVGAMGRMLPEVFWTHMTGFVSFVISFIFIWFIDITAASIFLALAFALYLFNQYFAPRKRTLSRLRAEASTRLNGQAVDVFTNIAAARQYVRLKSEDAALRGLTEARRISHVDSWLYTEKMLLVNGFLLLVAGLGMFWSLITGWQNGTVSSGELVLVLSLVAQMSHTLLFIGRAVNEMAEALGEMEEGLADLLIPHEITDRPGAADLQMSEGLIDWQNVTFSFDKNTVFSDFNITIEPRKKLGLVGHSGAGKTTFVSLLLRQHDLQGGGIRIDGQDISQVTQDSLRANIAVVLQEPLLFHRTIRENILYGNQHASVSDVEEVAKKAQAHEFISTLPEGYDTLVGERGVKLSGGQKQRVAIARAMLKDAPILVLDEATSALDSESEVMIQQALETLMEGKTVIAIAHRLSTLRKMDRIILLEGGQVVEDGSHTELAEQGGTYQKLWEHQAGGFITE